VPWSLPLVRPSSLCHFWLSIYLTVIRSNRLLSIDLQLKSNLFGPHFRRFRWNMNKPLIAHSPSLPVKMQTCLAIALVFILFCGMCRWKRYTTSASWLKIWAVQLFTAFRPSLSSSSSTCSRCSTAYWWIVVVVSSFKTPSSTCSDTRAVALSYSWFAKASSTAMSAVVWTSVASVAVVRQWSASWDNDSTSKPHDARLPCTRRLLVIYCMNYTIPQSQLTDDWGRAVDPWNFVRTADMTCYLFI